jgi:hypothetical protein
MAKSLAIGDRVRLRRAVHRVAARVYPGPRLVTTIEGLFTDVEGGVVLQDRLDGFYCWNVADLERAPLKKGPPA